ncbi:phosphate propanoyltransferase [Fusobacterium sp. IOR10]|uniref:phosphate propanoyltransferase n=1 Tax=Fusobacterium sp. IOR10 TaxID=2665157 RepID=UPI0013D57A19|nr:phosphate propanoyltransferase [Fusobacterium sp. IOR10]
MENILEIITKNVIEKLKESEKYQVPIGVSNRHVHLCEKDLNILFGDGYKLTKKSQLKQPGQFAANEVVTIRGKKGQFEKVRILGPVRTKTQVEISITDSFKLGVKSMVKQSGHLNNTPGIKIIGPKGEVDIPQGTIVALRHIHLTPTMARNLKLKDNDAIGVQTLGERKGIMGNVLVRVSEKSSTEMHIDVDEANAFELKNNDIAIIKKKQVI